jgi:hypothetical protein
MAVKNRQFVLWPGLTTAAVVKHFPKSEETIKGHACKTRSNLRSTTQKQANSINNSNEDKIPTVKYHDVFIKVYRVDDNNALHNMYSNQTGRFSKKSSKDNLCIMVLVHIDSGGILVAAMKNRTAGEMIKGISKTHQPPQRARNISQASCA